MRKKKTILALKCKISNSIGVKFIWNSFSHEQSFPLHPVQDEN